MRFTPVRWTHHHTHRLVRSSLLASSLCLAGVVLAGMLSIISTSEAYDINTQPPSIGATATIPEITSGTTTSVTGSSSYGATYFPPVPTLVPPNGSTSTQGSLTMPTLTLFPQQSQSTAQNVPVSPQEPEGIIYTIHVNNPSFFGQTNIPNAILYITINGPLPFRSTAQAGANGSWSWTSPEQLPPGNYRITVIAQDPNAPGRIISKSLHFVIGNVPVQPPLPTPTTALAQSFDVFVKVSPQTKIIYPGQTVTVAVRVVFNNSTTTQTAPLEYTVTHDGQVVATSVDTVTVTGGQGEFLKTFNTNPLADTGGYTVTVRLRNNGLLASAYDMFAIQGRGVVPVAVGVILDATTIFQILLVLFLLFTIIAYFEYNKVVLLSRVIKQVTEEDLKKED